MPHLKIATQGSFKTLHKLLKDLKTMVIRIYIIKCFQFLKFLKRKKIVPHIRLSGVIGSVGKFKQGLNFVGQQEIINKAFSIKKALAIAISINSPGGSPVQSHLIYSYIRNQAKKNNKKVLVFAEDVAASGGYLIACAGDEIYANSSSIIGSIGVIYSASLVCKS